jgi:hypothetical protein
MLCVNMQTSFMHPPFGFALFYLRGVAPKEIKSADIYWGAIPFVGLQIVMVALVISFPTMVTGLLKRPYDVDPTTIRIELEAPTDEDTPAIEIEGTAPDQVDETKPRN